MREETVCPWCGRDIPVTDKRLAGQTIVITGECPEDGTVEITE